MKTQYTTFSNKITSALLFCFLLASVLVLTIAVATPAEAYRSFEQTTTKLNDTTILFTITFAFGTKTNEFFIPSLTNRNTPYLSDEDIVGYELLKNGTSTTSGTSHSIVLADLSVTEGEYRIPVASTGRFTFVSVVQFNEPILDTDDYQIQITSLPHYVGEARDRRFVNEFELATFITPSLAVE